ncbi:TPA: YdaU family protein [Yersinia enterocolitica]
MAALPYMQLYIADYLADTMHLSTEEHGAYLLIMFNYWQTGKAIPKVRLAKIARLSNERWISIESSLNEFFIDNGIEWIHDRIEHDLAFVHSQQKQRSDAGKASAKARKSKTETTGERTSKRKANERTTVVKIPLHENPTNKDPDIDKELKDKTLLSHGEKNATGPNENNLPSSREPEPQEGKNKRHEYPPEFEVAWLEYPRRPGSPDKHGALKAWNARLRDGITADAMLEGVRRYAAFVKATGKTGTEFIKQAKTFFGPSKHFDDEWQVSTGENHVEFRFNQSDPRPYSEQYLSWEQQQQGVTGMAPMGSHDQNLREPLDCEEWQSTIGPVGAPDWGNDQ